MRFRCEEGCLSTGEDSGGGIRLDTASRGSHARQQARREKAIYTPHAGKTEEAPQEGDAVEARRQRVDDGVDLTV